MASNGNGNCLATKMPKTDPTKSPKCSVFPELLKQFLPLEGGQNSGANPNGKLTETTKTKEPLKPQKPQKPRKP